MRRINDECGNPPPNTERSPRDGFAKFHFIDPEGAKMGGFTPQRAVIYCENTHRLCASAVIDLLFICCMDTEEASRKTGEGDRPL